VAEIRNITQIAKALQPYIDKRIAKAALGTTVIRNVSSGGGGGEGGGGDPGVSDHDELTNVTANQHHNQIHAIDGADHTGQLAHSSLSGITDSDHHAPVTAGDGIDVTGQQVAVDVSDFIVTASGLGDDGSNNIEINFATNSGLIVQSSELALGTPSTIAATTTNTVTTFSHNHAVTASSNPGASESLLKSTSAGGLTLESFQSNGSITALESLYAAASSFRVIHHTHDGDHAHVVINPTGSWSLDEQFGLDVDDNLLVRGWIVGKHAIQVEGAKLIAHYDGPEPYETNYDGEAVGSMGQAPVIEGGLTFRAGKFLKAAQITEATTNLVTNPSFETNTTGWLIFNDTGGDLAVSRVADDSLIGTYSAKLTAATINDSQFYYVLSGGFTSGTSYSGSVWMRATSTVNVILRLRRSGPSYETYASQTFSVTTDWQRFSISFTAAATVTGRISIEPQAASTVYVDAVQVETKAYSTPYCDGTLGGYSASGVADGTGHSWSGTAHASTSSRLLTNMYYSQKGELNGNQGTVMAWVKKTPSETYAPTTTKYGGIFDCNYAGGNGMLVSFRYATTNTSTISTWIHGSLKLTSTTTLSSDTWYHAAVTWDGSNVKLYIDGVEEDSTSHTTEIEFGTAVMRVGRYGTTASQLNGWIDDFAIFDRAVDADEIRAIYESNAPVFGETSTWHWRAGRNRVWADVEGLWMFNASGTAVLGAYAGDEDNPSATKSWGGQTLSESDFLIGDYNRGGYVLWDDSAATINVKGTILMQGGSTGIANFTDAGAVVTADDLDDIANGATYGRVALTAINGSGLVVLDQTIDGTYAKVLSTSISAGKILLSQATGDLDDIADGTYGRVLSTAISAGNILLSSTIGDLDDIADGTYGKVLSTAISAGNILLSSTVGDLDDISDGSTYGRVNQTILGAGFIQVGTGVKDTNLSGWKIDNTEIVGQLSGADQVVLDTNGRILAGGGVVYVDNDGVSIETDGSGTTTDANSDNSLTWYETISSKSNLSAKVGAGDYDVGSPLNLHATYLHLIAYEATNDFAVVRIAAEDSSNPDPAIEVSSSSGTVSVLESALKVPDGEVHLTGGDVGIGTSSPDNLLHLEDSAASSLMMLRVENTSSSSSGQSRMQLVRGYDSGTGDASGIVMYCATTSGIIDWEAKDLTFWTGTSAGSASRRLTIQPDGDVGINDTTPSYKLDVNGTLRAYGITDSSDKRLKTSLRRVTSVTDKLAALNAYSFHWRDSVPASDSYRDGRRKERHVGLIAQEVKAQFPELVDRVPYTDRRGKTHQNYLTIKQSGMMAVLVESIKELNSRLEALEGG
jgi:hypothetical protein